MTHGGKLIQYLKAKLIQHEVDFEKQIITINNTSYSLADEDDIIFDEKMNFLPENEFNNPMIYLFAGRWYVNNQDEKLELDELIYKGQANQKLPCTSFLGIRSGYELGNGLGNYSSYINKAKFLGTTALGICEKNTLAGVLDFQSACLKNGIKPIIGMTISVQGNKTNYDAKVYAKNFQGWLALLKFNEIINVDAHAGITLDLIQYYSKDIYFIADPKSMPYESCNNLFDFYQLDTVRFSDIEKDEQYINNLEKFIKSEIKPISIVDSFYLEQEDFQTREFMWTFLKKFDDRTENQFFKPYIFAISIKNNVSCNV